MKLIKNHPRKLFFACTIALTGLAIAVPHQLDLPAETAKLRPSSLPGYAIASQKCAICHSADYISFQPPGMTQTQWTGEVAKMQHAYGAPITELDVKEIGAYLSVAYGSAKATDAAVLSASGAQVAAASTLAAVQSKTETAPDPQTLLNANGCLGCHAIDKKVVGPAYHEVALKYKNDSQALANVTASIRQGGAGKWGQIPMPPFVGLNDAELHALATFVLAQ